MDQILSILGSVGFNWHVALANFFNFLIILFLLNKFFFKKLGKTIDDRHKIIERGLNQARDAEKALSSAQVEKEEMIRNARKAGQHIIASAEVTAEASSLSIAQKAEEEINVRLGKLETREASLLADVEKAFGEKAPALVAKLYAKTLKKEMTETDNNALIAKMSI